MTVHNLAAYCPTCLRVQCRCKATNHKPPVAREVPADGSFWSAKMGLGEWTPEDKSEVKRRADELLAVRLGCAVEDLEEVKTVRSQV